MLDGSHFTRTRFPEELAVTRERVAAAWAATRGSSAAITAGAATVALGLLALPLSELTDNRALGPVGAIGVVCAVLTTLTFLPAVLALLGRAAFRPAEPKWADAGTGTGGHGIWRRVAHRVGTRPRQLWIATTALLLAAEIAERFKPFGALGLAPEVSRPQTVDKAAVAVPVLLPPPRDRRRRELKEDRPDPAGRLTFLAAPPQARVTGGPAYRADISSVFDGADTNLLLATASVVAVLLLIT
ncbi:MMPL family transporter [Streptomyces sp. NPDC020422]|uniref:MMPL family transporter n=1 Tax=Streptomyces sp. NPDC020422 TaxID=3365074 RepID=UPI0037A315E8